MQVIYKFFAIKPIRAEHPVGSGIIVEYQPGDEIPAGEWGRAANNLVELDKAARVAFNVPEDGDIEVEAGSADATLHVTPDTPKRGRPKSQA